MDILIIILIILLILSIINNFLMYNRKVEVRECPTKILNKNFIPNNLDFKNITFFYKKNLYNKCHKDDLGKNNINKRYEGNIILNNFINNLKKKFNKKIYILENKNKSSNFQLNDENIISLKKLV